MSRLGKVPIPIPAGVTMTQEGRTVRAKGPKGELSFERMDGVRVEVGQGSVLVHRDGDERQYRSAQGLVRRLVINLLQGVSAGFTRTLEINGVGYRADARGPEVHLSLGYSHPIVYRLPTGVTASVEKQTVITLAGADRQLIGEVAANIRKLRPPEPYKGKGIRYSNEQVRRKAGKAGASS